MNPVLMLTPDAPEARTWDDWQDWFRSLLPGDATWHRCCIGIPDEPEQHINVSWGNWKVEQVASWYEILCGRTVIVTPRWEMYPLRRVVAVLRTLEALPMPGIKRDAA